jgi:hypothetical protein
MGSFRFDDSGDFGFKAQEADDDAADGEASGEEPEALVFAKAV